MKLKKTEKKDSVISVITVVKDDASNIRQTLQSVIAQTYPNIQYIVIDGGSTDGTTDIVYEYSSDIDVFISETDEGIYDAMNKGIQNAAGEWVFFLNSGDIFNNESVLSDLSRYFVDEISLIFGDVVVVEQNGKKAVQRHKNMSRYFLLKKTICHQSILFRKELFSQIGLFNTYYNIKADYEWLLRFFFKNKKKSLHVDMEITKFRKGGYSDDANKDRIEKMKLVKKYFSSFEYLFMFLLNSRSLLFKNNSQFEKIR